MRQRFMALACVLCLLLALTACNNSENKENTQETGTPSVSVAEQPSNTLAEAPTLTPTETLAPTETPVPTETPTPELTETPAPTETPTPELTETPAPTETPTPEPTETPTPTPEPVHEHSYTKTIIKEAGCWPYNPGTTRYTCSCGHSYEEETFLECTRDNVRVVVREANCTEPENTAEHCIYCGTEMYTEMSAPELGHTPNNYWVYHVEQGQYTKSCSRCNYIIERTTVKPEGEEIKEMTGLYFD